MRFLTLATIVMLSTSAFAQPSSAPPITYATSTVDEKSPVTGIAVSIGFTVASYTAAFQSDEEGWLLVAALLGPSPGRWYNHELGGIGIVTRVLGSYVLLNELGDDPEGTPTTGLVILAAGTIYDWIESGRGAERYNRERRMQLAPMVTPQAKGVAMSIAF